MNQIDEKKQKTNKQTEPPPHPTQDVRKTNVRLETKGR